MQTIIFPFTKLDPLFSFDCWAFQTGTYCALKRRSVQQTRTFIKRDEQNSHLFAWKSPAFEVNNYFKWNDLNIQKLWFGKMYLIITFCSLRNGIVVVVVRFIKFTHSTLQPVFQTSYKWNILNLWYLTEITAVCNNEIKKKKRKKQKKNTHEQTSAALKMWNHVYLQLK